MVITAFKVIQGHRFWYQSKAHYDFLLVINNFNTNLPPILHRFKVMADYVKFSLATRGRFTSTPSLGAIPCEYRHK